MEHETLSSHKYQKPIRLKGYDYTSDAAYAITMRAKYHCYILCHPHLRHILETEWTNLAQRFPGVEPATFMVMPDHVHCMLIIHEEAKGTFSVSQVIGAYKSIVFKVWRTHIQETGINLPMSIWQRRFYEHVVRDDSDFAAQTAYILNNPIKAALDKPKS
ncbi:hypothetical protein KDW_18700 [Dictyobacter vulcani]|uniref:Transposase IS200-like domain-containing protein n=1 Tax=Dictyobacter vulcani TaxID=2607529 RepID=A0A5J4KEK7_9CHLR|nr:transposase [Dictyobacter vulcani]GER87708.1 hypothetical protein KDW_18700 [Dictyobacter vulcani]